MPAFLVEHEALVRLAAFTLAFGLVAAWELAAPRRALSVRRRIRWTGNFALAVLNSVVLRLVFPAAAVGVAWFAEREGLGWLHHSDMPPAFQVLIALLALDLAIYFEIVLSMLFKALVIAALGAPVLAVLLFELLLSSSSLFNSIPRRAEPAR